MAVNRSNDPFLGFKFVVEINGLRIGAFSEVTGLQVEIEVHDYREGGVNDFVHKLAGPARYPTNLVLKHGLMDSVELWDWIQDTVQGRIIRRNGSIVLQDSAGKTRWRWNFKAAYPVKWSGPDMRAAAAEVAVETLELAHRGLTTQPI